MRVNKTMLLSQEVVGGGVETGLYQFNLGKNPQTEKEPDWVLNLVLVGVSCTPGGTIYQLLALRVVFSCKDRPAYW